MEFKVGGSVLYVLLFCTTLPSLYTSQAPSHEHHSRLDTNPDELRPVRPQRRMTTQKSITVNDEFLLPEPPNRHHWDDNFDSNYDYDYDYDGSHHSHDASHAGSGTIHEHDHEFTPTPTEPMEEEYVDPLDGHKDHLTDGSTAFTCAWYIVVLSLFLIKMVALI